MSCPRRQWCWRDSFARSFRFARHGNGNSVFSCYRHSTVLSCYRHSRWTVKLRTPVSCPDCTQMDTHTWRLPGTRRQLRGRRSFYAHSYRKSILIRTRRLRVEEHVRAVDRGDSFLFGQVAVHHPKRISWNRNQSNTTFWIFRGVPLARKRFRFMCQGCADREFKWFARPTSVV